jgi:hypothetical protein
VRPYFRRNRSLLIWRPLTSIFAVFVLSYILFDVLDLDLSNFPLKQAPVKRTAVATEVLKGEEHAFLSPNRTDYWVNPSLSFLDIPKESLRLQHKGIMRSLKFNVARIRLYRIALPRSFIKDPPPPA